MAALAQCLEARREQPCPDTNDLALNALDCLHKVAPRLQLAGLPSQLLAQLLSEVCHSMMTHDTPLRVRGTAAGVVQRLAQETQNLGSLAEAAGTCLPMHWTSPICHSWPACSCSQTMTLRCEMHALSLSEIQSGYSTGLNADACLIHLESIFADCAMQSWHMGNSLNLVLIGLVYKATPMVASDSC